MASGRPIIRQISWLALIPLLVVLFGLIFLFSLIDNERGPILGAGAYVILTFGLRFSLTTNQRKGVRLFKAGKYVDAIEEFKKSVSCLTKNPWIDKYRAITVLSVSKTSYTEMAMLNIAFCYSQIGNGSKAVEWYKKTLVTFPASEMAKASLKLIESVQNMN